MPSGGLFDRLLKSEKNVLPGDNADQNPVLIDDRHPNKVLRLEDRQDVLRRGFLAYGDRIGRHDLPGCECFKISAGHDRI